MRQGICQFDQFIHQSFGEEKTDKNKDSITSLVPLVRVTLQYKCNVSGETLTLSSFVQLCALERTQYVLNTWAKENSLEITFNMTVPGKLMSLLSTLLLH